MDGIGGKGGWAWIFILEGLATVIVGIVSFWMVHDFPDDAKFLSDADRARVIRRLKGDKQSSAEHEEFKMAYFWAAVKDYKTWLLAVIYMGADGPLYAFSLFLPTIISGLGTYTPVQSQLLTIPPYAAAAIATVVVGYIADRTRQRGLCNIFVSFFAIAGFAMLLGGSSSGVQYAGTFLAAIGIYVSRNQLLSTTHTRQPRLTIGKSQPCIPNTISWGSNNIEGVYKRGVAMGIFIGWGNLNGIMSSNIYQAKNAPRYFPGHSVLLAYLTLFLLGGSTLQYFLLKRENKKRLSGERDGWVVGKSAREIELLGDRR